MKKHTQEKIKGKHTQESIHRRLIHLTRRVSFLLYKMRSIPRGNHSFYSSFRPHFASLTEKFFGLKDTLHIFFSVPLLKKLHHSYVMNFILWSTPFQRALKKNKLIIHKFNYARLVFS